MLGVVAVVATIVDTRVDWMNESKDVSLESVSTDIYRNTANCSVSGKWSGLFAAATSV
jgi:hypothetical protein